MNKHATAVLTAPIRSLLIRLTIPSIFGMLGIMIFNIVDTYFVGQLGTEELAAISFTFPVVILFGSFTLGLGTAIMVLFSRAVGSHNVREQQHLATSGLILAVFLSIIIAIVGYFTIEPLFRLLGASDDLMPYIVEYMKIWYMGAVFIVIPMMGDHILRGLGDTKTPSYIMLTCAIINGVLDPLLIFGYGPFPQMGIAGAALATVFARMITMFVSLYIQGIRLKLLTFKGFTPAILWKEFKSILYLGLPNSVVKMILPVAIGIFTAILAKYGHETVAGFGVATKIEGFVMAVIFALSITAAIFVGQNLSAKQYDRVQEGIRWLYIYSFIYGIFMMIIMAIFGRMFGAIFSDSAEVQDTVRYYLLLVPFGYGMFAITQVASSIVNVLHKPLHAGAISLVQMFVINVPLAMLLSQFFQARGVFVAIGIADVLTGLLALYMVKTLLRPTISQSEQT